MEARTPPPGAPSTPAAGSLPVAEVVRGEGGSPSPPSARRPSPSSSPGARAGVAGSAAASSEPRSKLKRSPSGGQASMSRINQLYESHKKKQEKLNKRRELEKASPQGCTFQPKLEKRLSRSSDKFRVEKTKTKKKASGDRGNPFERLYAGHKATQEKIARARAAKLEEKCTFKPRINKPRKKKNSQGDSTRSLATQKTVGSRHDLLYQTASAYELKRQKSMQTLGMEECTFSPKTNSHRRSAPKNRSPLYDGEAIRIAQDVRNQKRREQELKHCTFEPNINRRGAHMSTVADGTAAGERLYKNAESLRQKRMKASMDAAAKEEVECTFKPKLSTKKSIRKKASTSGETAFDRLYGNAQKQREAREAAMQRASLEYEFQPKINNKSRELARHSDDRSLHEYLYKEGLAKTLQRQSQGDYKTTMRHRLEEEELEKCTFDPKLWKNAQQRKAEEARAAAERAHHDQIALEALELEKKRALLAEEHFKVEQARAKEAELEREKAKAELEREKAEVEAKEQEDANRRAIEFAEKVARAEQRRKESAQSSMANVTGAGGPIEDEVAGAEGPIEDEVDGNGTIDDEDEMW